MNSWLVDFFGSPPLATPDQTRYLSPPRSCAAFPLVDSLTEAQTGAVLELPFGEHTQLLAFLLGLRGSLPSIRQQRFTFQLDAVQLPALSTFSAAEAECKALGIDARRVLTAAGHQAAAAGPPTPPLPLGAAPTSAGARLAPAPVLTSGVFEEAPDPHALTDGSSAVAVLLPSELDLPAHAFAGSDDVLVGVAVCVWCMQARRRDPTGPFCGSPGTHG